YQVNVFHERRFCQFKFNIARLNVRIRKDGSDFLHQSIIFELSDRKIDGHHQFFTEYGMEFFKIDTGLTNSPVTDGGDQSGIFRDGNKFTSAQYAALRMI